MRKMKKSVTLFREARVHIDEELASRKHLHRLEMPLLSGEPGTGKTMLAMPSQRASSSASSSSTLKSSMKLVDALIIRHTTRLNAAVSAIRSVT